MIGILLPMTALGLMLQQPFNTLRTKPLIAPGTGTRAVVPLTMVGGFAEDLENKITEAAEKKIKEAEGLVETNFEDLEYKTKADIAELSRLDKQQMLEAVEKLVEGEDVGLPSGQFELLKKILQILNVPVILGEIIQLVELLLELGREGIDLQLLLQIGGNITVPVGPDIKVTTKPLSSMWQFDADFDALQTGLASSNSRLIRRKAQTWDNVMRPNRDVSKDIETSYEWSHEFFPNLRTRGFDPTLRPDGDQIPGASNFALNQAFAGKLAEGLQMLTRDLFNEGLPMTPEAQGVWNDEWAGKRKDTEDEETFLDDVKRAYVRAVLKSFGVGAPHWPNPPYKVASELSARTEWLTTQYFDTTEVEQPDRPGEMVSQDMSLRYLGKWDVGDDGSFDDKMFSQFYMAGIGQSFVYGVDDNDPDANGAKFVADNNWCTAADVLEGQGKYGGKVYFNGDGAVMHIVYDDKTYSPDDDKEVWEFVKMKCRSTVLMVLTALEHLLGVHLSFSNSLSMATPKLPPDHALRRLLWPHIFNGIGVNRKAAATLSLDGGLFTRGWGVKLEGVHKAYKHVAENWDLFKFQTPIELKEKRNLGKFGNKMPLYEDGIPFYKVIRDYVGEFVDLHYDDDDAVLADVDLRGFYTDLNDHLVNRNLPFLTSKTALSDVLATYIYYVTGYHTHAGTAHTEAATQGVAPSSFYEDQSEDQHGSPPNAASWSFFTYIGTASLTLPITGDTTSTEWKSGFKEKASYFWLDPDSLPAGVPALEEQPEVKAIGYPEAFEGYSEEQELNKDFAQNLIHLQGEIIARNKMRHNEDPCYTPAQSRVYNCFDINFVESGVAI